MWYLRSSIYSILSLLSCFWCLSHSVFLALCFLGGQLLHTFNGEIFVLVVCEDPCVDLFLRLYPGLNVQSLTVNFSHCSSSQYYGIQGWMNSRLYV